ncbi:helix-turn-helix transcriptional regulator [Clostridium sp. D46t1_190503_E9]|uniref:helix-turn-helix transcriptional regulator n=1 Tax=Clostridium sp. D46t1_190503_E9 TaxID=2787137 RepID=UPI001899B6EA|nr:helix-turn-helix transcriptional regulator [Clostridium sp. D46t1_190503_E9]
MTIDYAILGMLSWQPLTGYDIKKIIQESPFFYWSGNNNQIYKSLVKLLEKDLVVNEVKHQEGAPSKKIYSITELGVKELENWIINTNVEVPEFKKQFLIQLAWSGRLELNEVETLLSKYELEVKEYISMYKEEQRREKHFKDRTNQEYFIWKMLYENMIMSYENELNWIEKVRKGLLNNFK